MPMARNRGRTEAQSSTSPMMVSFFNGNSHVTDLLLSFALYTRHSPKNKRNCQKTRAAGFAEIILDFPTRPVYNEPNNYIAGEFV